MLLRIIKNIYIRENIIFYLIAIGLGLFVFNLITDLISYLPTLGFVMLAALIYLALFVKEHGKYKEEIFQEQSKEKAKEVLKYKEELQKQYKKVFKESEFDTVFDKKIFSMIDLVTDLNNSNLQGVAQYRVQNLINNSLKIYLINAKAAAKMVEAHSMDIDLKEEILNLLEQNNTIITKLKNFITRLILLQVNSGEFNQLISSFEESIKTLDIIKDIRKDM